MRVDQPPMRSAAPFPPQRTSEAEQPLVIVVDDDASVREALSELIKSAGFEPICFSSAKYLFDSS